MGTSSLPLSHAPSYPVGIDIRPTLEGRNRLTTAFRLLLALPHLVLVGGPIALGLSWSSGNRGDANLDWGAGGVLGVAAAVAAVISWFAIVFTGRHPEGLWSFATYYLRWRVRAVSYVALLRDEYPPFGEAPYPAMLELARPEGARDRLGVAFRPILAIPQLIAVWALGIAWAFTTVVAWFAILFTGRLPEGLARFGVGVFRWSIRVEAYLLLLRDEYPPFSLS